MRVQLAQIKSKNLLLCNFEIYYCLIQGFFLYPLVTVEHFLIVPFYLHCTRAVFTSSRFYQVKKSKFTRRVPKGEEAKKRAEPSTWLANYTHTCAPTCRYLAHVCRRERQSASLLLHSSYIYYCPVVHIYTAAAWRLLSFLDVVRGGVREGISEGNTTVVEHLCAMQRQ